MTQTEMDLRTEIAILKDQMRGMIREVKRQVMAINPWSYTNAGMGGFEYDELKTPVQMKNEVVAILDKMRPTP